MRSDRSSFWFMDGYWLEFFSRSILCMQDYKSVSVSVPAWLTYRHTDRELSTGYTISSANSVKSWLHCPVPTHVNISFTHRVNFKYLNFVTGFCHTAKETLKHSCPFVLLVNRVRPIPCKWPTPDTIGHSYTDTNTYTDTGPVQIFCTENAILCSI